jgi:hypothetical protein
MIVRRILFINVILLGVIAVLAYGLYTDWQDYENSRPLERIVARLSGETEGTGLPEYHELGNSRLQKNFYSVAENDLFHPDRRPRETGDEKGTGKADAPKFPKDPEMQGVIESRGEKKALITVFDNKNSASGESRIVGINETIQGWTVSEITNTTTKLTWNDLSEIIDIFGSDSDGKTARKTSQGKKASINIVKIGSRQAVVDTTTLEAPSAGESGLGSLKSSSPTRVSSSVGSGRFSSRPSASPGSRPGSSPD